MNRMNRCAIIVFVCVLLAAALASGCGAERDAATGAPIDWPARAATVKVGMTRFEVEKILPGRLTSLGDGCATMTGGGCARFERYVVAEDWVVIVSYDFCNCRLQTKPWTIDQEVVRPQKQEDWYSGHNRLLKPVQINKVMRSSDDQKEWRAKAASIKVGMTRAEAERNMPAWCGFTISMLSNDNVSNEVYEFAKNWRLATNFTWSLTIDYDIAAGEGSVENRVIKPVRIETMK
jgi:hypothetical protein